MSLNNSTASKNKKEEINSSPPFANDSVVQDENPEARKLRKRLIQKKPKGTLRQRLSLLLWKNLLLRRRHWFTTAFEIFLPTLVAVLLAFVRTKIVDENPTISLQDTVFPTDTELVRPNDKNIEMLKIFREGLIFRPLMTF